MIGTLHEAVRHGLTRMLARKLDRTPGAEELPAVIAVMVEDLRAEGKGDRDADMVRAAIDSAGRRGKAWPTISQVLKAMPEQRKPVAEDRHLCAYFDQFGRCPTLGTLGAGGESFYCRKHFCELNGREFSDGDGKPRPDWREALLEAFEAEALHMDDPHWAPLLRMSRHLQTNIEKRDHFAILMDSLGVIARGEGLPYNADQREVAT